MDKSYRSWPTVLCVLSFVFFPGHRIILRHFCCILLQTPSNSPTPSGTPILPCDQRIGARLIALSGSSGTTAQRYIGAGTSLLGFDPSGGCGIWVRSDWRADVVFITLPASAPLGGTLNVTTCGSGLGATLTQTYYSKIAAGYGCPLSTYSLPTRFACPTDGYFYADW